MKIEDRPVNDIELRCIAESLAQLRKQKAYVKLLREKEILEKKLKDLLAESSEDLRDTISNIRLAEYEIGWWDGKGFETIYNKLTNEEK